MVIIMPDKQDGTRGEIIALPECKHWWHIEYDRPALTVRRCQRCGRIEKVKKEITWR